MIAGCYAIQTIGGLSWTIAIHRSSRMRLPPKKRRRSVFPGWYTVDDVSHFLVFNFSIFWFGCLLYGKSEILSYNQPVSRDNRGFEQWSVQYVWNKGGRRWKKTAQCGAIKKVTKEPQIEEARDQMLIRSYRNSLSDDLCDWDLDFSKGHRFHLALGIGQHLSNGELGNVLSCFIHVDGFKFRLSNSVSPCFTKNIWSSLLRPGYQVQWWSRVPGSSAIWSWGSARLWTAGVASCSLAGNEFCTASSWSTCGCKKLPLCPEKSVWGDAPKQ